MNILVIDVGTSSMRGIVFDEVGKAIFKSAVKYSVKAMENGIVEQPPSDWENALVSVCRAASAKAEVDALALTCQRSSIIPVDAEGQPLRSAIMWQDTRNADIVSELSRYAGRITEKTGARLNTVFSGTKMTWLRRNEPKIYEKTHKICTIADYLTHIITGEYVTDATYGARSLLMNIRTRAWDEELLSLFEVEEEKLCRLVEPGSLSGEVTEAFSRKTGLRAGIPLISAGGDQQCGAVGNGAVSEKALTATFGTGAFMIRMARHLPAVIGGELIYGAHAIPGALAAESSMLTCSALYDWGVRTLYPEGIARMNEETAAVPIGANGVTVLPYYQGRGTPDWNSAARGVFFGLNLSTTRADIARAILESIALESGNNIELMEKTGPIDRIYIGGGFTNQPVFPQMLADVSDRIIWLERDFSEQTARGAWIVASVSMGLFSSYEAAFAQAVRGSTYATFTPNAKNTARYQTLRAHMNELYRKS